VTFTSLFSLLLKKADNYLEKQEDGEGDIDSADRSLRFREAFDIAKAKDEQGYNVVYENSGEINLTVQDLTAISWAAFCTEEDPFVDSFYRLQALDCKDLFKRLKLASLMLKKKIIEVERRLETARNRDKSDDE